jgi:TRAP-type mannitol/chloroaromatic compound transport system permease small subunit
MSQEVSVRGTGGAVFAGILLIIGGALWMLQGLAAIVKGTSYLENRRLADRQGHAGDMTR